MWQPNHPCILSKYVEKWLSYIHDNASNTPFNKLKETMQLACTMLGDNIDKPELVQMGALSCTINSQAFDIDVFRGLVCKLIKEAPLTPTTMF
jgi:hypothetical protein